MNRTRVAVGGHLVGPVNKFIDALTIGDGRAVFGQGFGNGDIIDFLEPAGTLTFQRA